jgi:DNA polymerase-3 subunit chi
MTEISFHFNVFDKLAYSCRLLRKAYASGAPVVVTGSAAQLASLNQLLWTFSPVEFVPHSLAGSGPGDSIGGPPASAVLLSESPGQCPHHNVLVNLGQTIPEEFERFERFIEIVTGEEEDRLSARLRWKHYADRGYSLQRHDRATAGGA